MTHQNLFYFLSILLCLISLQSVFAYTPYIDPLDGIGRTGPAINISRSSTRLWNIGFTSIAASRSIAYGSSPSLQPPKATPAIMITTTKGKPSTTPTSTNQDADDRAWATSASIPKKTPSPTAANEENTSNAKAMQKSSKVGLFVGIGVLVFVLVVGGVVLGFWYRARRLRRFSRLTPAHTWKMLNDPYDNRKKMAMSLLEPPQFLPQVRTSNSSWQRYVNAIRSQTGGTPQRTPQPSPLPSQNGDELEDVVLDGDVERKP